MKKFLSIILATLLIFSVMAPVTVFAENGPYPNVEGEDVDMYAYSYLSIIDFNTFEMTVLYPQESALYSEGFPGASYDLETNTLTLNNAKYKNAVISAVEMGDDFKIKLIGYNEFAEIGSSTYTRGGSITITGTGELVLNRTGENMGLCIDAGETASVLKIEDTVKLKVYSSNLFDFPAVAIYGSSVTDADEIMQLGGAVKADNPTFKKYTKNIYEQAEAYDTEWNSYDWYEFGLEKDGVYYIADEAFDETTYESTGEYIVYSVSYDELIDCYTLKEYGKVKSFDGFTVVTEFEPIYDENSECFIGYNDYFYEEDQVCKTIFFPEEKEFFDLCVDENGTKYGFWQYEPSEFETIEPETYIYKFVDHPEYGMVAIEDETRNSLDGLTPLKIGEKELADCYYSSDVVINNGGAVVEPGKVKGIELKNTNQGIKVSWKANSKAETYRIYRKADGDKEWKILDTVDSDETFIYDNTAKSGIKYTYTVRAGNYVGWGNFNTDGVTITHLDVPQTTAKNTSKGIYLKWTKISGAEKYQIYRQKNGSSKWTLVGTTKKNTFTDKKAKSGTKYNYRVRAVANGDMSNYETVGRYYLSTPKLSSAKNTSSGVKVSWEKVNGAQGYKIYRKTSKNGNWKLIDTTTSNKKFYYVDKTAKNGKTYYYSVQAYYSKTNSTYNKTGLKARLK